MSKSKLVEDIYPLIDPATARILRRNPLVLRWAGQRKSSWDTKKKVCFLDTIARKWSCAPICVLTREENGVMSECVFDGAHKLEAICEFIHGDYAITEIGDSSWKTSPLQPYVGKTFSELPPAMQNDFMKYEFTFNYVPDSVANDPETRKILWGRLNNAGTPLNGYELDIPVYGTLHTLLEEQATDWTKSAIYIHEESSRGQLEEKLYHLLALSDDAWQLPAFSSLPNLNKKWRETLGGTVDEIHERIHLNKSQYSDRLKLLRKFLQELENRATFSRDGVTLSMAPHQIPLLILLGRLGYWFPTFTQFNINADAISKRFKEEFFLKSPDDLAHHLGCSNRNATFQNKLIAYVDAILEPLSKKERRYFTKAERKAVLARQNGRCALCREKANLKGSEADHIIPVCQGGKTTIDNCQVLHRHCHQNKSTQS